jgi:hypothetical protein
VEGEQEEANDSSYACNFDRPADGGTEPSNPPLRSTIPLRVPPPKTCCISRASVEMLSHFISGLEN